MAQAQPQLDFCELPEPLPEKAKVIGSIKSADTIEREAQTNSISAYSLARESLTRTPQPFPEPMPTHRLKIQKLQWAYQCVSHIRSQTGFQEFFNNLKHVDKNAFDDFGGQILHAIDRNQSEFSTAGFDDKYLILIQLLAHADLSMAIELHERAEQLWINVSNSLVRYTRLRIALEKTRTGLNNQKEAGATLSRILPLMQGGIREELINAAAINKELIRLEGSDAVQWCVPLEKTYRRSFQRFTTADDNSTADMKWINATVDSEVNMFTVMSVPATRVCKAPTGIAWKQANGFHFNYKNSDMYHYFRMSGIATFSPITRHLQTAYFLPRIGNNNRYHTLVDKLPALLGYTLMGLNCPIVSTYPLDDTERHFCEQLGIDPDEIIYDNNGALTADRGMIPDVEGLRAPFFEYCQTLVTGKTHFGKKIYITRANSTERPLVNELDVQKLMLKHGFGIVAMENYSLLEQLAIARNADIMVSPHGAGLSNMVFSQPGTAIVELIPDRYMTPLFKQLAIDCNHRYSCLIGNVDSKPTHIEPTLNWQIDLNKLASLLLKIRDL